MKTALIIMAAGIGSRFGGGIKQLEPVGPNGEIIMDYSIHDAIEAGFNRIVFIIRRDIEADFREVIGDRIEAACRKYGVSVGYAFQSLEDVPAGVTVPEGRFKPWGTGHAVLCARDAVDGAPFAAINADDYYGKEAMKKIYAFLENAQDTDKYAYCMVAYNMGNTVTENGSVARGICQTNTDGFLTSVVERTRIEQYAGGIHYIGDDGESWVDVAADTPVSMNMWGFTGGFMEELAAYFPKFLTGDMPKNPQKAEMFLPTVVSHLIGTGKAAVKVLRTGDKWYGVTYAADKPVVIAALQALTAEGKYPDGLWG